MNRNDRLPFTIRSAGAGDEGAIVALLRELADYEKLEGNFQLSEAKVARDMLGPQAAAHCGLLLRDGEAVGLAVWYPVYRSFPALRGLYVEDLYVRPEFRGHGGGRMLLAHMAHLARGGFLEWRALDWNKPARDFYDGLGAVTNSQWIGYRLMGEALERLAS